jgi:hypothetical protein
MVLGMVFNSPPGRSGIRLAYSSCNSVLSQCPSAREQTDDHSGARPRFMPPMSAWAQAECTLDVARDERDQPGERYAGLANCRHDP